MKGCYANPLQRGAAAASAHLLLYGIVAFSIPQALASDVEFSGGIWKTEGEEARITSYQGESALYLKDAVAVLQDESFENGVLEFRIAFPRERGFAGIRFRAQEGGNYEHFYLRPHLSGKPDANQYTPVFHGNSGWQIYYGPRYSAPTHYKFEAWMKVRLVVSGDRADVYISSEKPVLHIADLKREAESGSVALSSFLVGAYFTDFRMTRDDNRKLTGAAAPQPDRVEGLVREWDVAGPFQFKAVAALSRLSELDLGDTDWSSIQVETNGIANLGRLTGRSDTADTLLARLIVPSEGESRRLVKFGYSDDVLVFVNGRPVYQGTNLYRSRDYRYLGTVGLFDGLIIDLRPGRNEIVFAVRESFGGWAVMAQFVE